jgi:acyl-CoA thioester hydrolase
MSALLPGSGEMRAGRHAFPVRVYYEDTDAGGIVYHANFLRFAERARSEFLRLIGWEHAGMTASHGLGFAVRRCEVDFLRPARLDDSLVVETTLLAMGGATLDARQVIGPASGIQADGLLAEIRILADIRLRLALITAAGRPGRIPAALRAAILPFLSASSPSEQKVTPSHAR